MVAKRHRAREGIILFIKENNKSDIRDDMDPDQARNKYLLQL